MAGSLTHAYFILDLYDKLSIKSKELLMYDKEYLKTFSLSNDILINYSKKDNKFKNFSTYFENNKVNEFFMTLINYIKYNNHQYNSQVISYLYAMLSHYILDSSINPYIIYKTGVFNKNSPNSYKYNMLHEELELLFDNYLVSLRTNKKPYKFKCYNFCFNINNFNKELIEVIDFTYKEVFGIDDFHNYYLKSISNSKKYFKKYKYDSYGIKKNFYYLHDRLNKKGLRKVPLSYHHKLNNKDNLFNLNNNTWYNPIEKRNKSNKSIIELYVSSLDKTANIIQEINKFLYYDKKINLKKLIGNLSYITGKECDKRKALKYFEF